MTESLSESDGANPVASLRSLSESCGGDVIMRNSTCELDFFAGCCGSAEDESLRFFEAVIGDDRSLGSRSA